ncbi:MAG: hypothetical protein E5W99_04330, partial [Mesorhizobium sp.]
MLGERSVFLQLYDRAELLNQRLRLALGGSDTARIILDRVELFEEPDHKLAGEEDRLLLHWLIMLTTQKGELLFGLEGISNRGFHIS